MAAQLFVERGLFVLVAFSEQSFYGD